ncbi:hybrid sensor histidine kinase/response regulator transcription factor [Robertkochia solimangrovi]|uniref:hybrid sensor histidine kinase/response regulator transcription factor n=1 Tax=Robertkochia solimangrovi TaxID=2213046 RepID=UPI00117FB039|nr:hybrid sensor histidine kinase/response regulator transcription factor [Robertkochia solimangrovi]TRZ41595.1 hypothetical protein DMZ48_16430 [Robertkochia solimangrovi]
MTYGKLKANFPSSVVLLILLFIIQHTAFAQNKSVLNFDISKGLAHNSVRSIIQDHDGFIWVGTYDGLNKFDGYEFKIYRNSLTDSTSIPHNYIYKILEDVHQNLWIGTGQGICKLDKSRAVFEPVYYFDKNGNKLKIDVPILSVASDNKGKLYIGTSGNGFLILNSGDSIAKRHKLPNIPDSANLSISCIAKDPSDGKILLSDGYNLFKYDPITDKIKFEIKVDHYIAAMAFKDNILWIGTSYGLYKYDLSDHQILKKITTANSKLSQNVIETLFLSRNEELWIGTQGKGFDILNLQTEEIDPENEYTSDSGFKDDFVYAIIEDDKDQKWIGTKEEGVKLITNRKHKFQTVSHIPYKANSLTNDFPITFYEDAQSKLWIGTEGGGFSIWDRKRNNFQNFKADDPKGAGLSYPIVSGIKKDQSGKIWISTYGGGINTFDVKSNTFTKYECRNPLEGIINKNVNQLYIDHNGDIWASTYGNGRLYQFDKKKDEFKVLDQQLTDLNIIQEDESGTLWAGNSHQLIRIDRTNNNHTFYEIGKPVRAVYTDVDGKFWIGSEGGGLLLFDRKSGQIKARYSTSDGLCNNSALCILEDNSGYLWLSTFNGLSRFNKAEKTFENFYQENGLQSNQFLYRSALKLKSGELVFGGVKGFNIFNPDSICEASSFTPPLYITDITIDSENINSIHDYVMETSDEGAVTKLKVPYNKANLSFKFAALEFFDPSSIKYAYFLEGWDQKWQYTDTYRYANYSNLREGNYILHIKSSLPDGSWAQNEVTTKISILPPWYRSWWAYTFYLLILLITIKLYSEYHRRQDRLKHRLEITEMEMEKEKELNEKKLSFFTNISHEFRTPLSLIIAPMKDFLNSKDSHVDIKELIIIYRNARRLLSLVDQLLIFRNSDANDLKRSQFDIVSFSKEVFSCFLQQARIKKIKFDFVTKIEALSVEADREKIEVCLFNLLSNAFKYTEDEGKIELHLKIKPETDLLIVEVKDTGKGIDPSEGEKIFENFYQVKDTNSKPKGFGIGLHLIKKIAEQHKGSITYKSIPEEGTTFILELPIIKDSSDVTIDQKNTAISSDFIEKIVSTTQAETISVHSAGVKSKSEMITDRQTIMIVDDNVELRSYIKSVFYENYLVKEASGTEEASQLINEELPDIIITDIVMRDSDSGLVLCERIKKDPDLAHIPVILLTSSTSAEVKLKGIEGGADDFITKPFDKEILKARVSNLLKSRNHMHRHFYNQITLKIDDYKISDDLKEFLDSCIRITEQHIKDPDFNVKTLAEELDMSHSALYRKVKLVSGKSVNEFIRFIKLRKAAQLLIDTECNISESAYMAGFNDIGYFRQQFKKVFGMNPSKYARQFRNAAQKSYKINQNGIFMN